MATKDTKTISHKGHKGHEGAVLDFGLAKLTQVEVAGLGSALPTTPPLAPGRLDTTPGMVLGTIGYMAPEQVKGVPADHRADIFALGAILYEMLTGRRAFRGEFDDRDHDRDSAGSAG